MKTRFHTHRSRRWRSQLGKTMRFESFWRQRLTLVSICSEEKHCAFSSGNYTSCPSSCKFHSGITIHLNILWSSCESRTWTITCCVLKRANSGIRVDAILWKFSRVHGLNMNKLSSLNQFFYIQPGGNKWYATEFALTDWVFMFAWTIRLASFDVKRTQQVIWYTGCSTDHSASIWVLMY